MKQDLISLETKKKLAAALKKAMEKKSFDKITVKELLEYCDISRPTFYYHFEDIYDLMKWMFETEAIDLLKKSENCLTWDEGILLLLTYIQKNSQLCPALEQCDGVSSLHIAFLASYSSVDLLQRRNLNKAQPV